MTIRTHLMLAIALIVGAAAYRLLSYYSCPTCDEVTGPIPMDYFPGWLIFAGIVGINQVAFLFLKRTASSGLLLGIAWPLAMLSASLGYFLAIRYGWNIPARRTPSHVHPTMEACLPFFVVLISNFFQRPCLRENWKYERWREFR